MRKIMQWFFEGDNDQQDVDQDDINLGPIQVCLIIIMAGIFLFWIFFEPMKESFNRPAPLAYEYIARHIEKDYFTNKSGIKNNDFSKGFEHWVTSDGGTLFPDSKSIASIENKDFYSAPSCMRIECLVPASRYHYSKKAINKAVNNVYSYQESLYWMGVLPRKQLKSSLWYKGDILKFSIHYLTFDGEWGNLANVTGQTSSSWTYLEINQELPPNARAIMLEITLNQAQGMPLPIVFVDDINVEIK